MAKRPKRPRDTNQLAKFIVDRSVGEVQEEDPNAGKSATAMAKGRSGGLKGGKARAERLSAEERRASAVKAARARWTKKA